MANDSRFPVEVVYAASGEQRVVTVQVPEGATAAHAVRLSGLMETGLFDPERDPIGIFGRRCAPSRVLRRGDRVAVYRPLQADPKAARRKRAMTRMTRT